MKLRGPLLLMSSILLLAPAVPSGAVTALGSLDCDRADASTWRGSAGSMFGQGQGVSRSFSVEGLCYARLSSATRSQRIRLANLGPDGYTGIPLMAAQPEVRFDVSTSVRPTTTSGSSQLVYVLLRKEYASQSVTGGHEYRARISFTGRTSAGRNVLVKFSKVVAHVETTLGSELKLPSSVAYFEPNRVFHVKVALTGTNPTLLQAKVWAEGQDEPAGWQVTVTDSDPHLQQAGRIELLTKVSSANVALPMDFMFDNLVFSEAG